MGTATGFINSFTFNLSNCVIKIVSSVILSILTYYQNKGKTGIHENIFFLEMMTDLSVS